MSFSQTVKEEILKNTKKIKGCCATAFLTAVLRTIGNLCLDYNGYCFSVESDNGELLQFCSQIAHTEFQVDSTIYQIRHSDTSDKNIKYSVRFGVELGEKLHLVSNSDGLKTLPPTNDDLKKYCCRRAFLQGLFLCCGSATIPDTDDQQNFESKHRHYHLELRFFNQQFADFVQKEFAEIEFKQVQRKNTTILYLKDSEKISDFLSQVDAVNAKFAVENIIIGRSFRNRANRQRNCIDSNIDKSIVASGKHLAAIEKIRQSGKFDTLPLALQEVARTREENPEANLAELAAMLHISKSGVNHRLAKLVEISQE